VVESPSLEVFKKTCRCGTSGHGLVGMVLLGGWLDLMILEVFSNLNDSMKRKCWKFWHSSLSCAICHLACYQNHSKYDWNIVSCL